MADLKPTEPMTKTVSLETLQCLDGSGDILALQIDGHDVLYLYPQDPVSQRATPGEIRRVLDALVAVKTLVVVSEAGEEIRRWAEGGEVGPIPCDEDDL